MSRILMAIFISLILLRYPVLAEPIRSEPIAKATIAETTKPATSPPSSTIDVVSIKNELAEYIDRYADKQLAYVNWILGLIGAVGFLAISIGGYLVKRYVDNAKDTVELITSDVLFKKLESETKSGQDFSKLVSQLREANTDYTQIKENLLGLREFHELTSNTRVDPTFAHDRVSQLTKRYIAANRLGNMEEVRAIRSEAIKLLEIVVNAAMKAEVDPNTVFNTAADAGRLDFDTVELQLNTLASHLKSSPAHQVAKADNEHSLGRAYEYKNGSLTLLDLPPEAVRKNAFESAINLISQNPRQQSEIVYSRTWNMAEQGRENGTYDKYISAIEEGIKKSKDGTTQPPTSYAYVMLFQLHLRRSDSGWREAAITAAREAIKSLKSESPLASWYKSSRNQMTRFSQDSGLTKEVSEIASEAGLDIDLKSVPDDLKFGGAAELKELLASALQKLPMPSEKDNPQD